MMILRIPTMHNISDPTLSLLETGAKLGREMCLWIASGSGLVLISRSLRKSQKLFDRHYLWHAIVFAPITEELLFRGGIQQGFGAIQKLMSSAEDQESLEDIKRRQFWQTALRVHVTALLFALAHLKNGYTHLGEILFHCSWCYFGGVAYGYLAERFKTLSLPIMVHGLNNALVIFVRIRLIKNSHSFLNLALIALPILVDIGCYWLATDRLHWLKQSFITLPRKFEGYAIK